MFSILPTTNIPARYWIRAGAGRLFTEIQAMAQSGAITPERLQQIRVNPLIRKDRDLAYSLISLFLLLDDRTSAEALLRDTPCGREMKRYLAVLSLSRQASLPIPSLSTQQEQALANIESRLQSQLALVSRIQSAGGYAIVGNAPGNDRFGHRDELCSFYFNHYRKNTLIQGDATVHVITPSWQRMADIRSPVLLMSGNSVFNRRSRVWERFHAVGSELKEIYTSPRVIWQQLHSQLNSSPTAGLLVLRWVNAMIQSGALNGKSLEGYVGGFSLGEMTVNHAYDNEPASARHNWMLEPQFIQQIVRELHLHTGKFTWVPTVQS